LPGVEGCILAMADGLFITGQLPAHLDQNTVSVFAPQLFKKVGRYVRELRVGHVRRLTIFTDQQPMTIFQAGDVYLVVIHDARRYSKVLLRRCERISQEIARLCRQRAVV
jgi:predicted regulator of Ras-like GTPase activity (Roadblock/LC7/MglB family)